MSQKKSKKSTGCLFLPMCCGSDSIKTENFDEFEDKTLERGKVLLEQYEESHRRVSPERPRELSQQTHKRELDATLVQFQQNTQKQNEEKFKILKNEQERTFPGDDIDIILDEQKSESLRNVGKIGFTSKQNITEFKEVANITAFKKKRDTSLDKVDNPEESSISLKKRPPTPKGTMSKGALDELKFKSIGTISPRQIKQKLAALKDVQGSKNKAIDQAAELSKERNDVKPLEVNSLSLEKNPIAMKKEKCVDIEQNGREAMDVERQTQEHNIAFREDEMGAKRQREETHRNASMDRSHVESKGFDQEDDHSKDLIDGELQRFTTAPLDTSHAEAQKMKQNIQELDTRTQGTEQSTKESANIKNAMPKEPEHITKASKDTMPEGIQQDARGSHISKEVKTIKTSEDTTSHHTQLNMNDSKIEKDVKLRDIEQTTRLPSDTRRQDIQQILTTVDSEQNRRDLENTKFQDIKQFIRSSKNAGAANLGNTVSPVIESNVARPLDIQQITSATCKGKDDNSQDVENNKKTDVSKLKTIEQNVREKTGTKPQDIGQSSIAFKDIKNASSDYVSQTTRASSDAKLLGKDQIISISEDITDVKPREQIKIGMLQSKNLKQEAKSVRFSENDDIIPPDDTPMDDNATAQSLPLLVGNPLKTFGSFTIEEEFAYIHSFGNSHLASSSDEDVSHTLPRPEDVNVAQGRESIDEMTNSKFDTPLSYDQPVPPTSPVLGSVDMFRPSKPQLPQEKFTFLNKNVDLPETTGGDVVPLRKGSVNTDLLGVFCTNSDSSVIANYSGSSSEPELAKLIDMKSSDEFLPTKPVFKPATIPLRESSPVIKNVVPDNTSDFSNSFKVLQNADVKVSQTKLGASSLVLGPINSPSSMKTPEKKAIPTQADVRVRPPSAGKLEFSKPTPVLHGFLENGMKVLNDHPSNDALLHGIQRTASQTSESFVDGHQSPLSNKVRTVQLSGSFKKSTDAFPVGQSAESMVLKSIKNDSFNGQSALGSGSRRNVTNIPKPDIYCAPTTVSGKLDTKPTLSKAERRLLQRPTQLTHHLAQGPGNNGMESQDISSKSSFPEVKGASSKDTTANKAIASPRTSAQNIKSGYSLPTTSSGEKSKGRPKLKYVSTDSESDGSKSQMKSQMRQPGSSHQQITHQPKPPDSPACTRVTRQRRKRPPNTKASDSSSGENIQKMSARRAWGAQKHVPAPPLAPSAPRHRPPPDRVKDEDERERTSGASTSSLPGPLPPPDLLAPSLFKRRAGQGLPTVTGNVPLPSQQPGRTERQDSNTDTDNRRAENQSTRPQLRQESIISKASSQPQMSKLREKSISKLDSRRGTSRDQGPQGSQESTSRSDTRRGPPQLTGARGSQDSMSRSDTRRGPPQSTGPQGSQDSTGRSDTRRGPPQSRGPQGSQDSTGRSDIRRGPPQSRGPQGSQDSTGRSDTRRGPPQSRGPQGSQDSMSRSDTTRGPPQSRGPQGSQDSTGRSDIRRGPPQSTGPQGSQDSTGRSDTRRGPPQSTGPQGSQDSTGRSDTTRGPPQSTGPQGSQDSTGRSDTRRGPPQSTGPHGSQDSTGRSDTRRGPPQSTGPQGSQDSTGRSDTRRGPPQSTGPQGSQDSTGRSDTRRGPPQSTGQQGSQD